MDYEATLEDVARCVASGGRVLMMVRHAEREHIPADDPTFGETLPITESGRKEAVAFGKRLKTAGVLPGDVQFLSSPLLRTRMTAECIRQGLGADSSPIPADGLLGNESFYFTDRMAVWRMFRRNSFFAKVIEYIERGEMEGFAPVAEATDRLEEFVLSRFTARLGIFTTHDLYNAAFLKARGARPQGWTPETWVGFLDSAAIFLPPGGGRFYALVRK